MSKIFGFMSPREQSKFSDLALLFMRVGFGLTLIYGHGFPKLMKLLGDDPIQFADPIGIGMVPSFYLIVFAEFVCASLVVLGLFTRWATVPIIIAMLVATFLVNWPKPFSDGEMAFLFLLGYVGILMMGPGRYSLDSTLINKS